MHSILIPFFYAFYSEDNYEIFAHNILQRRESTKKLIRFFVHFIFLQISLQRKQM